MWFPCHYHSILVDTITMLFVVLRPPVNITSILFVCSPPPPRLRRRNYVFLSSSPPLHSFPSLMFYPCFVSAWRPAYCFRRFQCLFSLRTIDSVTVNTTCSDMLILHTVNISRSGMLIRLLWRQAKLYSTTSAILTILMK